MSDAIAVEVEPGLSISALYQAPARPTACYVLAHGAGAGMHHRFLVAVADGLAARRIATLRFQFPFMERGSKRPDSPPLAHATIRAAVQAAGRLTPAPLIAGGKSFGGRMTSQAQAAAPLPGVFGLAFLGFPLHPAGKPSADRAAHLARIAVPMLFLQGTRDPLADFGLLAPLASRLDRASLVTADGADHSFHVPARSGRTDAEVLDTLLDAFADWAAQLSHHAG